MKLPPAALTAPSLCPRCDSPAMYADRCGHCGLQLRTCPACRGVAGPFDRFCGFCGHDLFLEEKPTPVRRLWLLVAVIPLAAALAFGVSPLSAPIATQITHLLTLSGPPAVTLPSVTPAGKLLQSKNLKLSYLAPTDWSGFDYTLSTIKPLPMVVLARLQADAPRVAGVDGDIIRTRPSAAVVTLRRATLVATDPTDATVLLAFQVGQLTSQPPASVQVEVAEQVAPITVNGLTGSRAVLKVTTTAGVFYLERAYLNAGGAQPLFEVEGFVPQADWKSGEERNVDLVLTSIKLT